MPNITSVNVSVQVQSLSAPPSPADLSAGYSALRAVSSVLADAQNPESAGAHTISALRAAGIVRSGALLLGRPYSLRSSGPESEDTIFCTVPTRYGPGACLELRPAIPLPDGLLDAVISQLGATLDRLWLEEHSHGLQKVADRRSQELSSLYELGHAIGSMDIERLLGLVTEKAARLMNAQACSLMRLQPQTQELTISASWGLSKAVVREAHRTLGEGIAGRVAQTGEPMLIVEAGTDPRLEGLRLRRDIGSSIVVPLKVEGGRVLGVLSIRRRRPAPDFKEPDLELFSLFAAQAALALANAQLLSDLLRHIEQLSTLSDLTERVISTLDLASVLELVADNIVQVVKFARCAIFLRDPSNRFVPRVVRGYTDDQVRRTEARLGEGVVGTVAESQAVLVVPEAVRAESPIRGFARALGAGGFVALPIVVRGQSIGVVIADNHRARGPIPEESVSLLTTFARHAGLAIENAQLYQERERRYQEMNRLALQTDNILRSIAAAVIVVDSDGSVTRWNDAARDLLGAAQSGEKLTYADLAARLTPLEDERSKLRGLVERVGASGAPERLHRLALHPRDHAAMVVDVLVSPLVDRQGNRLGVVQVIEDLTREVRLDEEVGRIRRLADIGQLAAKMAHEVRNPLSSIKGAAQLMRAECANSDNVREFLDIIIDEVNGLSRITTDLLDFARPAQLELEALDLNQTVAKTLSLMRPMLEDQRIIVRVFPQPDLPLVVGDRKQLEQALRNLVLNAAQAMQDGGRLTISLSAADGHATIAVRDTGPGIPAERMADIFQPFVTTKTKGTGLGLPIVRKIVDNHGGRIRVWSAEGEGATFLMSLPLRPPDSGDQMPERPLCTLPDC